MHALESLSDARLAEYMAGLRTRSTEVEFFLDIAMPDREAHAVRRACDASGVTIGAFYCWYFHKARIARLLRQAAAPEILALVARTDRTDYAPLDAWLARPEPLIVAIPHHGHYVLAMSGLIERIRARRPVMVFYADPKTRRSNEVFDAGIANSHWSQPGSGVQVLHDDRAGLAEALKGLRQGKVLIIMPDVGPDPLQTRLVPFLGGAIPTMLGTATLSRKTGAVVLPVAEAMPNGGLDFATHFAAPMAPPANDLRDPVATLLSDYSRTCELFAALGELMKSDLYRWQFVRAHFASKLDLPQLEPSFIAPVTEALLASSRANPFAVAPLRLS